MATVRPDQLATAGQELSRLQVYFVEGAALDPAARVWAPETEVFLVAAHALPWL